MLNWLDTRLCNFLKYISELTLQQILFVYVLYVQLEHGILTMYIYIAEYTVYTLYSSVSRLADDLMSLEHSCFNWGGGGEGGISDGGYSYLYGCNYKPIIDCLYPPNPDVEQKLG